VDKVENGSFVSVDYKGILENGQVFDTSHGRQAMEIQMGAGRLIKGFENELMGMALNEKKVFTLAPEDAYGKRDEDQTHSFSRSEVPPEMNPEVGMTIGLTTPEGQQVPARIVHVDDEKLTFDLNHPPTQTPMSCGSGCDCSSGCGH